MRILQRIALGSSLLGAPPVLAAGPNAPPGPLARLPPQVMLSLTPEQLDLIAKAIVNTITPYEMLLQSMQGQAREQAVGSEPSGF